MKQDSIERLIPLDEIPKDLMVSNDPKEFYAELLNSESAFETLDSLSVHEEKYKNTPIFWQIKSYLEQNIGYLHEATESIEKAISLSNQAPRPLIQKAELLFSQGEDTDAIDLLSQMEEMGLMHPEVYRLHAEILTIYGDTENALTIISQGKELFPEDKHLTCGLVQTLYDLNQYDEAEAVIDGAITLNPDNANFLRLKAKILSERCDYAEALSLIEKSLKLDPTNPDILETKADIYFGTGDFQKAKAAYDEILELPNLSDVKRATIYYNRALVLSNLNENEEALESLKKAAEFHQLDSHWYHLKATILMDLGELKEASAVLEEASILYPEEAGLNELSVLSTSEGWWAGGAAEVDAASRAINNQEIVLDAMMADVGLLYEEGKYDQALSVLDECLDFSEDKTPFLSSKANILCEAGDYPAALTCYDMLISTLLEADKKDQIGKEAIIGALSGKVTVLIHLDRFDEALVLIDSVLVDNPASTAMIINKGICYEKMENFQEALSWFEYACFVDPQSVDGWIARGRALELLDENASALESYVNSIRLDSTNLTSRTKMIALLFKLKRHDDLLVHSERALHIYPYDPSILSYRGKTLEILGEYEEAVTCFQRALEVCHDDGQLSFALGRTLSKLHRDKEAIDHLVAAMNMLENSPDILAYVGHTLIELGKYGAAVDIFNRGLQEHPEERDLIAERDRALQKLVMYSNTLV